MKADWWFITTCGGSRRTAFDNDGAEGELHVTLRCSVCTAEQAELCLRHGELSDANDSALGVRVRTQLLLLVVVVVCRQESKIAAQVPLP
jgi:hypothetical protein